MKFPSLCVCKPASFPGQKTEQAAINYKEILSSCGRFATTRVSKANRYGVLGSLVPCTAAIPNPGPQILLQQIRGREGGRGGLLSARCSVVIPTSSSFLDSRSDRKQCAKMIYCTPPPLTVVGKKKLLPKKESYLSRILQDRRNLTA